MRRARPERARIGAPRMLDDILPHYYSTLDAPDTTPREVAGRNLPANVAGPGRGQVRLYGIGRATDVAAHARCLDCLHHAACTSCTRKHRGGAHARRHPAVLRKRADRAAQAVARVRRALPEDRIAAAA